MNKIQIESRIAVFLGTHKKVDVLVPNEFISEEARQIVLLDKNGCKGTFWFFDDSPTCGSSTDPGFIFPKSYTTSLDVMHEAEKALTIVQREEYLWHLRLIEVGSGCFNHDDWNKVHLTAEKKANAFIRALNLDIS